MRFGCLALAVLFAGDSGLGGNGGRHCGQLPDLNDRRCGSNEGEAVISNNEVEET